MLRSLLSVFIVAFALASHAQGPMPGTKAPDFTLSTPEHQPVELASLEKKGDVVLVVLRGYPGYQCPYCQRQLHDLAQDAAKFAQRGLQVLLVYPGNASQLDDKAKEFLGKTGDLPTNFHLVIDPEFAVTNLYGLRWDAPHETAYPSTFILDRSGTVLYRKVSHEHGDRATTADILAGLDAGKH
jgi:peroxiredoxin